MQSAHVIQRKGVDKMLTNLTRNKQQTWMISIEANDIMYTFKNKKKNKNRLNKHTKTNNQTNA